MNMSTESTQMSAMPNELQKSWRYLMGVGILIGVLGILAILAPFVTGIAITVVLGALLVIGALGHVAHAFSARGWKGSVWQIVLAVVYAFAGISLIANPVIGLTTLTILVIAFFLAEGVVEILAAHRGPKGLATGEEGAEVGKERLRPRIDAASELTHRCGRRGSSGRACRPGR